MPPQQDSFDERHIDGRHDLQWMLRQDKASQILRKDVVARLRRAEITVNRKICMLAYISVSFKL